MEYHNRLPEEGINTPQRHPLLEFIRLSIAAVVALCVLGLLLNAAGGRLGALVPYRAELWIADRIDTAFVESGVDSPFAKTADSTAITEYLATLGARVEQALEMQAPMTIQLHYSSEDVFNAFATLGGHVYFYKGLLKELPHENALVMLIAHEYSHVQLRHTARGVGGGLAVALGAALLPGGGGVESRLYTLASQYSSLNFSRDMETEADINALRAVQQIYGHVNGADDLFELFVSYRGDSQQGGLDGFFSTHPLDSQRIEMIKNEAEAQGFSASGELTPLPAAFSTWLGLRCC
ncbi:MAG: M48 family metallopeptidase [Pseudomonadota bacterium]